MMTSDLEGADVIRTKKRKRKDTASRVIEIRGDERGDQILEDPATYFRVARQEARRRAELELQRDKRTLKIS